MRAIRAQDVRPLRVVVRRRHALAEGDLLLLERFELRGQRLELALLLDREPQGAGPRALRWLARRGRGGRGRRRRALRDPVAVAADVLAPAAVAFAEAGTWEPVEQLTRDVYTRTR